MAVNSKQKGARFEPIKGFDNYLVSDAGHVLNRKTGRFLKPRTNNRGYVVYCLSKKGKHYYFLAHRLVAEAFIPNPNNLPEVNHKDEDKSHNYDDNLEWCTRKYNTKYGTAHSRMKSTQGHPIEQYSSDGRFIKRWCSIKEASRNGYDFRHIQACLKGKAKTHKGYEWRYAQ